MELENEVKAAEAKAEAAVSEVKAEVVKVAEEVHAEAKKVEGEIVGEFQKAKPASAQALTAEEILAIREIENSYLKAQIDKLQGQILILQGQIAAMQADSATQAVNKAVAGLCPADRTAEQGKDGIVCVSKAKPVTVDNPGPTSTTGK